MLDVAVRSRTGKKKKAAEKESADEAQKLREELERLKSQLSEKE